MAGLKGTGAGDKKRLAFLAVLGIVVVYLAFTTLFGGPSAAPPPPAPVATLSPAATAPKATDGTRAATPENASLDPTLHPEWMARTEDYVYKGSGRNIFSRDSAPPPAAKIEKVTAPVRPSMDAQQQMAAAGPPPIELRFFGYSTRENGKLHAFLIHNDDVFIASVGDVVSHRYKVVGIAPTSVQIEDLPLHDTQTLRLAQGGAQN